MADESKAAATGTTGAQISMKELRKFVALSEKKKELKAALEENEAAMDELEPKILAYMQENGMQNVNVDSKTVYIRRDIRATFVPTPENRKWLSRHKLSDSLTTTINPQRASAIVREIIDAAGIDGKRPKGLETVFKIYEGFKISVTSGGK
jgi:hypothetical protein